MPIGRFRQDDGDPPPLDCRDDETSFHQTQVDSYVTSIKHNTYHLLDNTMHSPLQKLTLPDGSIIFTIHRTIHDLVSALTTTEDTHTAFRKSLNTLQKSANKKISRIQKNIKAVTISTFPDFSPTKIIKTNSKQSYQRPTTITQDDTTIHFIPDIPKNQASQNGNPPRVHKNTITMPKCYAKELLTNIDFDALDFDQAKTIHSKLHIITPTLSSQVDYSHHTLSSLREALLNIKKTHETYNYVMDAFPPKDVAPAPDSYSITPTFPLDALASLTHDQAMAMLTNYYNSNDQGGKCKTLHRKDREALILIIHDIIKELQVPYALL